MNQLIYSIFDKVTVRLEAKNIPAVLMATSGHNANVVFCSASGDAISRVAPLNQIAPGHYDTQGNWTPYLGEPCHVIDIFGQIVNFNIVDVAPEYILAKQFAGPTLQTFVVSGSAAIDINFHSQQKGIVPQWVVLGPGHMRVFEQ